VKGALPRKAASAKARATRNLTLRPKSAKAVKGGISSDIVPCYKPGLIIPCIKNRKPYEP
jgi:hypothetical protein